MLTNQVMRRTAVVAGLVSSLGFSHALIARPEEPNKALSTNAVELNLAEIMNEALQDEYLAHETYSKVLTTLGDLPPFVNIVQAEKAHIAAIHGLFESRGWPVPASLWNASNVQAYQSLEEACAAGVEGEQRNIALYDCLLALDLPEDVRTVFENVQSASRDNHLGAFENCQ